MLEKQVTSISFFKYERISDKFKALKNMGVMPPAFAKVDGLHFSKLMGSGRGNGFSIKPNFGIYAFLGVWNTLTEAQDFLKGSLFGKLKAGSTQNWTCIMKAFQAHGQWDGKEPFDINTSYDGQGRIGVITRATIKTKYLYKFWKDVPAVSKSIENKSGRIFSIGIGELPLILQSTFSIWESKKHMEDFAYKSKYHRDVVQKTRKLGWYSEELFARFVILESIGDFGLKPRLKDHH